MNTEQKQRMLWIGGLALAAVYFFGPSIFHRGARHAGVARPPAALAPAKPLPASGLTADSRAAAALDNLAGIWQGAAPLPAGLCNLRLELRSRPGEPGHFAGYPILGCIPVAAAIPGQMRPEAKRAMLAQFTPLSAVLTGTSQNGSIQFVTIT